MSRTEFGTPTPVTVEVAGARFRIPPISASGWITAVTAPVMETAVLPGLLDEEPAEYLLDLLQSERVSERDLLHASYRAIQQAAGRDWWVAVRLTGAMASGEGQIMGEMILRGVNPSALTYDHWLSAVYALLTRNRDEKDLFKFNASLFLPPAIEGLEVEDAVMDEQKVLAMLRTMPGVSVGS